ncbi:MAG: hypothetical protein Q7R96_04050 [Nanoarchaeota archaeon]|nr:hypothetical protein [Nanoarchaeota archaeon]
MKKKEVSYNPTLIIFVILLFIIMFFLANLSYTGKYTSVQGNEQFGARNAKLCASGSVRIIDTNRYAGDTYQECVASVWVTKQCPSGKVAIHRVSADSRTRTIQCISPSARYSR